MTQTASTDVTLVTRVRAGSPNPLPSLTAMLAGLDPNLALYDTRWLSESVAAAERPSRLLAVFLGSFALFAVALAVVGLYAVMTFAAAQRRREVAIRMALGANVPDVTRELLARGTSLTGAGALIGTGGAVILAQRLSTQLHGVDPTGVSTYVAAALLIMSVSVLATWIPARRAAAADPVSVLRDD
jgi:ABC-type antimicrobial peptide transport system permease subunit